MWAKKSLMIPINRKKKSLMYVMQDCSFRGGFFFGLRMSFQFGSPGEILFSHGSGSHENLKSFQPKGLQRRVGSNRSWLGTHIPSNSDHHN